MPPSTKKPRKLTRTAKKVLIGFTGWFVLLAGIVMVPYPGPGWLVVFIGLSILSREFPWAARLNEWTHGYYDGWRRWYRRQPVYIQAIFWCLTAMTAVVTVWLMNGYDVLFHWLGIDAPWMKSPFLR